MKLDWTKHLKTTEAKEKFQNEVHSAHRVLERLDDLLTEQQANCDRKVESVTSYDSPSWPYLAADRNGFNRAISIIKALINLDQQKDY